MIGDSFELIGGPQDGAKVKQIRESMQQVIWLGPTWKGDGYAAYSTGCCEMFPCRYVGKSGKFFYKPSAAVGGGEREG